MQVIDEALPISLVLQNAIRNVVGSREPPKAMLVKALAVATLAV